jgi:NADH-quinone oxidoreductase subunit F
MEQMKVLVGLASCGIAAGANKVYDKILAIKEQEKLNFELTKTGCIGMCYREPLVEIIDDTGSYLYGEFDEVNITEIIEKHIKTENLLKNIL